MQHSNTDIVVIGTGLAGYTVARELRKLSPDTALTLITRDDGSSYSKPQLSTGFAQRKSADQLALASVEQMRDQLRATIFNHTTVQSLNAQAQILTLSKTDNGATSDPLSLPFAQLVLAVGAHQMRPSLQGDGASAVMTVNDLHDYRDLRNKISLSNPAPIILLGAGLIGCEFANDLAGAGFNVHVVTLSETALAPLLPSAFGHSLQTALSKLGVQWHCNTSIQSVVRQAGNYSVTLMDGTSLPAQAVLSATGLRPNIELAHAAGLNTQRGVIVDDFMRTSAANIYAIGDCAEREGVVLPYVLPLMNQARAVAKSLVGTPTRVVYPVMPVVVKTPVLPITFVLPHERPEHWEIHGDEQGMKCLTYADDGKLIGFALSGSANSEKTALVKQLSVNG